MGITIRKAKDGAKRYDVRVRHGGRVFFEGGFRTVDAAREALARLTKIALAEKYGMAATPPPKPRDPTVADLLGDPDSPSGPGAGTYLEWIALPNVKAPGYVRRVRTAARALLPFFGLLRVSELTRDRVVEYQRIRLSSPLRVGEKSRAAPKRETPRKANPRGGKAPAPRTVGPACVNRELLTLRACLTWAADPDRDPARRIERNPLLKVPMLREPEPRNPTLTADDEARLLAACRPPWLRELVVLLLATGLRPGEALALRWSDLNADQRLLTIRHSKTNRSRLVPVPEAVLVMLLSRRPARDRDGLVFTSRSGHAIASNKAAHHFAPIARKLGLAFTLHGCRHVFASRALSAGASLPQISAILGHRTLATSARYAHARLPDLQGIVDAVAARSRPKLVIVRREAEG